MIGREAYENPWSLRAFKTEVTGDADDATTRADVVAAMAEYLEHRRRADVPLRAVTRHMLGLFNGLPGARAWRRHLALADAAAGPEMCFTPQSGSSGLVPISRLNSLLRLWR